MRGNSDTRGNIGWLQGGLLVLLFGALAACGADTNQATAEDTNAAETANAVETSNEASGAEEEVDSFRTQYQALRLVKVVGDLEHPWSVAMLPDGGFLVTERPGRLQRIEDGRATQISGLPEIHVDSQGGLLDVVLHPDFGSNGWVYLTYSGGDAEGTATKLARGRLEGDALMDVETLFVQNRHSDPGRHYGSRLLWLDDGTLLMTIGDRGVEPERAQDPSDHAGTVLRLTEDGGVPEDNPFVGQDGYAPEVYSYGHRNIQGIVLDRDNNRIWATEHGPRGGDELNLIEAGNNYGWPAVSLGRDYRTQEQFGDSARVHEDEMTPPIYEILPTLAPSGLALVTSDEYPRWQGDLLAGGLGAERIRRLVVEDYEVVHDEELLLGKVGRIRDVREGPDGLIYVLSDREDGALYRLDPAEW